MTFVYRMRGLYTFALTGRIATYKTKTQGVALGYGVLGFQPGHTKLKAHGVVWAMSSCPFRAQKAMKTVEQPFTCAIEAYTTKAKLQHIKR